MTAATYTKEIVYDRETRDYAMFLNAELVGFARTYREAEITLDQLVYELLHSDLAYTVAALDGGDPETVVPTCPTCGNTACPGCDPLPDCLFDAAPAQDELREMAIADEAPHECTACGGDGCPCCDPELASETLPEAVTLVDPEPGPPVDDGPDDTWGGFRCGCCGGAHHIQRCPRMWRLLMLPLPRSCPSCGDPILCPACTETGETLPAPQPATAMTAIAA